MTNEAEAKRRLVEESFGQAAPVYDRSPYFAEPGRRLVEAAALNQGARVLDIASGRGAVLFPAAERVGPSGYVQGIDLAGPMVEATSREIVSRGIGNAQVRRMNAEHLDFSDETFDAVTCGFALWFIPELKQALAEVRRVLKPGGKFATSTWAAPTELSKDYQELLGTYGVGGDTLASHRLSTVEFLGSALRDAGFEAVSAEYMDQNVLFRDEDEWWERSGSMPQLMQDLSSEQMARLQEEARRLARRYKGNSGIDVPRTFVIATARSPA